MGFWRRFDALISEERFLHTYDEVVVGEGMEATAVVSPAET